MGFKIEYPKITTLFTIFVLSTFIISLLTACDLLDSSSNMFDVGIAVKPAGVTIIYPPEGTQLQVGEFVDIHSQIADPAGITAAILMINNEPLRHDQLISPIADGDLYQPWIPPAPGSYILQVFLESGGRDLIFSNQVTVYVGESVDETVINTGTPTPTIIVSTEGTITPTATFTLAIPTNTPTEEGAMATGVQSTNCRFGPATIYDVKGYLGVGETVPIVGRNADSSWWVVELTGTQIQCWVWGGGVSVSGNTAALVIIPAPPTPTFTPSFTFTPSYTPKPPTFTPTPWIPLKDCHDYPDMATCNNDPDGIGGCYWDTGMNKCQP